MSFPLSLLHTFKKPTPVRKGWVDDGVGYIPLTKGLAAIVDPEMVPILEQHNWFAKLDVRSGEHYAGRWPSRSSGSRKYIHMARIVLGLSVDDIDFVPDHINRDKLDNRRSNLRVATHVENLRNRKVQCNSHTRLKGAFFDKRNSWYYGRIKVNGKLVHLGCRRTAQEAHELYCAAARKLHGEFYCAG